MRGQGDWRPTIVATCGIAMFVILLVWNIYKKSDPGDKPKSAKKSRSSKSSRSNKNSDSHERSKGQEPFVNWLNCETDATSDPQNASKESDATVEETPKKVVTDYIPEPVWVKVGHVEQLYFYPLKSGRGKEVKKCKFTEYGITVKNSGQMTLRDRMFLVYNEETRRFETARNYPTLILVSLSAVDESQAKLEAVGMGSMVFKVPRGTRKSSEIIECSMWWGEIVKCVDCGPEPAEWLSRFLNGTNSGLRLGVAVPDRRQIMSSTWKRYTKKYTSLRTEDTGLFSDLTSYMLLGMQSVEELNKELNYPVPYLQFRPNILVSVSLPFEEDNWDWIKIGEHAVIRNVKPCTRCNMVNVNPETGTKDKEEPLKTLKSFRQFPDTGDDLLDELAPALGIYCGLYITGKVRIGDEVFVHAPNESE